MGHLANISDATSINQDKTQHIIFSLRRKRIDQTIFVNPFMRCSVATIYTPLNEFCKQCAKHRFLNSSLNWMIFLVHNWINFTINDVDNFLIVIHLIYIKLALRNWIVVFVINRLGIWYLLLNVIVNNFILLHKIKIFDLPLKYQKTILWSLATHPLLGHCIK